jgi:hypothetical protein
LRSDTRSEVIIIALAYQNSMAERNIRIAEVNMRAILKEATLPSKFWDKAIENDIYIRNCTNVRPNLNGIDRNPIEAFICTLLEIELCKIWGSICFSYINLTTIPKRHLYDKL